MCQQLVLRFKISLRETFSNSISDTVIKKCGKRDEKYSIRNSRTLTQTIQMSFSKKLKSFLNFLLVL